MHSQIEPIRENPELSCRSILLFLEQFESTIARVPYGEWDPSQVSAMKLLLCRDFMSKYNRFVSFELLREARKRLDCPMSLMEGETDFGRSSAPGFSLRETGVVIVVDLLVTVDKLGPLLDAAGFGARQDAGSQGLGQTTSVYNAATDKNLTCSIFTTHGFMSSLRSMSPELVHSELGKSAIFFVTSGRWTSESEDSRHTVVVAANRISGQRLYSNVGGLLASSSFDLRLGTGIEKQLAIFASCPHVWKRGPYVPIVDLALMGSASYKTRYFAEIRSEQVNLVDEIGSHSQNNEKGDLGHHACVVSTDSGVSEFLEVTNACWALFCGVAASSGDGDDGFPFPRKEQALVAAAQACRVFIEGQFAPFNQVSF